ncbi:MAG: hypothetical protein GY851_09210 [bacterium]|nr:hypothetical protein [bacterium]
MASRTTVPVDNSTLAVNTISYEHHEIHSGSSFVAHYSQAVSDTGDKTIIAFKTPAGTKWCHVTFSASCTAAAAAYILEGPTVTDNEGATLAIYNRNRNSGNASTVLDTSQNPDTAGSATYFTENTDHQVTGGTKLDEVFLGGNEGPRSVGGTSRGDQEWVLDAGVQYAFVVESLDNNDNSHNAEVNWYEHTDKL